MRSGQHLTSHSNGQSIADRIMKQQVEQFDPWVEFAGMFKNDPLFDEFVEDMVAYRRELDAEITD